MVALAKPVDRSIGVFPDDQLVRVQQAYGLRSLLVLPFFTLNQTIIDLRRRTETARKVFLETERGVCFLKELPWYCSASDFAAFESGLLARLGGSGAPVPVPWRTVDGELFFHDRRSGSIFLLQPYVDGRSWTRAAGEARSAGAALARLHQAAAGAGLAPFAGMRDAFASARDLVSLLLPGGAVPTADEPAQEEVRAYARLALATIDRCRAEAGAAGYGNAVVAVHGDYNPFNLIFASDSDEVVGIVDFDNACLDDPAHDLAEALVRFGWVNYRGLSSAYGAVPSGFEVKALDGLLRGYRDADDAAAGRARPLLPPVMTAVALELAAIGLLSSYYTIDDLAALRRNAESLLVLARDAVDSVW